MAAKKILMLVGDYVEDYEAMVPFQMLTMVGHTVRTHSHNSQNGLILAARLALHPLTTPARVQVSPYTPTLTK
jgi:putative intracellular protease/amidase